MMNKLFNRNFIPEITHTLRWLYGNRKGTDASVFHHAKRRGLITLLKHQDWKCDETLLLRLLKKQVRTSPLPLNGAVLAGIGEMLARSHTENLEAEKIVIYILKRLLRNPGAYKKCISEAINSAIMKHIAQKRSGGDIFSIPVNNYNDWKETRLVFGLVERGFKDYQRGEYALSFLSRLMLIHRPDYMGHFVAEVAAHVPINTIVGEVAELSCFYPNLADAAMRTRVPVFVMVGAFSLGIEFDWRPRMPLTSLVGRLKELCIPSEGVTHICIRLVNEARIALRQYNQKIADTQGRIRQVKHNPHKTDYDTSSLPYVLDREQILLEKLQEKLQLAENDFTLALNATAGVCEIAEKTWEAFISISHQDAEYICRFALAHEGETRSFMLGKALSIFGKQLASQECWSFINDDYSAYWYAKAQVALSIELGVDPGHAAGQRIYKIESNLRERTQAPFAVVRNADFTNDIKLWAKLLDFAFHVALSFDDVQKRLCNDALNSARQFFPIASRSLLDNFKLLRVIAAHAANALLNFQEDKAREWLDDPLIPDVAKAYIIWSQSALLEDEIKRANTLAVSVKQLYPDELESINALTSLVDYAFSAHANVPVTKNVKEGLYGLWDLLPDTGEYTFVKLLTADIILAAFRGDKSARQQVIDDYFWVHSRIGQLIILHTQE
ncbi:hypothetical protein [Pectobacterium brasiliense]|uniref:hypothetical protein n=1 Tax=Pectobacterium brasiliense TaxID=180957 RepID=UPI0013DFF92F|nr:hypothetical protein [Pectobacterium brasiliense]